MIVNDKYNFVFIHIQKTAGASVSSLLYNLENSYQLYYSHSHINVLPSKYVDHFKFAFVRNPWDRLVSWYNMMLKKGVHNDFSKYLLTNSNNFSEFLDLTNIIFETKDQALINNISYNKSISYNQLDYISAHGSIQTNYIGKFENLQNDYDTICSLIGIESKKVPHFGKFDHLPYREHYSSKDINKVYDMYKKDIDYFKYDF